MKGLNKSWDNRKLIKFRYKWWPDMRNRRCCKRNFEIKSGLKIWQNFKNSYTLKD